MPGAGAAGQRMLEELRTATGQQPSAQDGPEGRGLDVCAGCGREQLGDRIGLLAGETALLDRERRAVAGGVDVGQAADATVLVDGDEAAVVAGDAADGDALDGRQRDDALGVEPLAAGQQLKPTVGVRAGVGVAGEVTCARASRSATAWLASGPKSASGVASGETSCRRASSMPMAWTSRAVMSASS